MMNLNNLHTRVQTALSNYNSFVESHNSDERRFNELAEQVIKLRKESAILEDSKLVLDEVKKALTKSSLEYCEKLATMAIQTIFNLDAEVKYSSSDGKFYLVYSDGNTSDIAGDEGGGIKTVIAFVFSLYLVIKSGCRRVLFFDEQFTQVSSAYLPAFIEFVKDVCKQLSFEVLLISHDDRISLSDVDTVYVMNQGICKRVK